MKTVCAYIRVSTDTQEEYSPDAQVRLLKEYAASHDMTIIDIYQDLGISGRKADRRPEFQDMIAMANLRSIRMMLFLCGSFPGSPGIRKSPSSINRC